MEWLDRLNYAINYIEGNLENDLDIHAVAREAASSSFHFQKIFLVLTGVTIAEYVRRRRLTLAAQELAASKVKIIDVALKYGYETPESFTKAFNKLHGVPPSQVRKGAQLAAYPRISFKLSIQGDESMNYRIVEKESFKVAAKTLKVTTQNGQNLKLIPDFWTQCNQDGTSDRLSALSNKCLIGICLNDFDKQMETFTYAIAVEVDNSDAGEFQLIEIPAATWAVFESIGPLPKSIQDVWARIYQEWFPATGYVHAGLPELEVYDDSDCNDANYHSEVWIPIKK